MSDPNTRNRIMLAAGPIFARKGYRSATIREICESADVNVASVNYYFGDKERLYSETVVMAREMRVQQVPYQSWTDETPPEQKLHDYVSLLFNRLGARESEPWQVRLLMREVLQPTVASRQLVEDYFRPFLEVMLTIVDEIIGFQIPDHQRRQIGFSILGQCLFYRFSAEIITMVIEPEQFQSHFSKPELADHITEFSLRGIESFRDSNSKHVELADNLPTLKHSN